MTDFLDRKLLIVTGKGGTGKTTAAAALARVASMRGKRVLLCEIDATGDVGGPFGIADVGFEPVEVEANLFVMSMNTEEALREYIDLNLKLPFALRLGSMAKALDFVATAAPGVREVLTIGKISWDVKRERYDLVVVDASATGHVVSQLGSPDAISELVTVGPLTGQTAWMKEILRDPSRTGAVIVTTPEEMPVNESLELIERLRTETQTPVAAVIVNRVLPQLFSRNQELAFAQLSSVGGPLVDAAQMEMALRNAQESHLQTLDAGLTEGVDRLFVGHIFDTADPVGVVDRMTDALAAEMSA